MLNFYMKEKILILEDEIGIRSFVSINLKREGYEVIEAECGQEAIDKINNEKKIVSLIDVILDYKKKLSANVNFTAATLDLLAFFSTSR